MVLDLVSTVLKVWFWSWIWCKTMPDCVKERRLDVGIWCKTMPDCAKERRLDVESMDVLDITLLSNSSAPQFCANLSDMMTNCAELHYSFTSTAWIWCKVMLDCAKGRRLHVESMDVLDITLLSNSSAPQFCANLSVALHHNFVQIWVEWWRILPNCTTVSLPQLESGAKPCRTVPKKENLM